MRRAKRAGWVGVALAVSALVIAVASCKSPSVRTATIVLAAADGGTLSGFNCIEDTDTSLRTCFQDCSRRCGDACREEGSAAREAGVAAATALSQTVACYQRCFTDESCVNECSPTATTAAGTPLTARANGQPVCVVIDLIRYETEGECRSTLEIVERCTTATECALVERRIHCVDRLADVPRDGGMEVATPVVNANFSRLRDEILTNLALVTSSAPEGVTLVRVMATTQERASLSVNRAEVDLEQVVGCATSCPVRLTTQSTVTLALDEGRVGYCRAAAVRVCAAIGTDALGDAILELGP